VVVLDEDQGIRYLPLGALPDERLLKPQCFAVFHPSEVEEIAVHTLS
jgi:hypothetical protein